MNHTFSDQVENCKTNCKPSSTAMFDNADSSVEFTLDFASESLAEQALSELIAKAKGIESEPCQICSEVIATEQGVRLQATFRFACQAEAVIFQMKLR